MQTVTTKEQIEIDRAYQALAERPALVSQQQALDRLEPLILLGIAFGVCCLFWWLGYVAGRKDWRIKRLDQFWRWAIRTIFYKGSPSLLRDEDEDEGMR